MRRHLGARLAGLASVVALVLLSLLAAAARAEPGVFPDRIVFGQVAALDGPAKALGQGMR